MMTAMIVHDTNTNTLSLKSPKHTEFQLHVSQLSVFANELHKTIDFSEAKLCNMWRRARSAKKKLEFAALIEDYRTGKVALAWRHGKPVYVRVIRDR